MNAKHESTLVRDLTEPGWREREAERMQQLFAAVPLHVPRGPIIRAPSSADSTLEAVAEIAHAGGLQNLSDADVLVQIRRLTPLYWRGAARNDCGEVARAEGKGGNDGCLKGVAGPLPETGWD